jgi:aminoglycoside phosphotransferase (APT) family kinase protein
MVPDMALSPDSVAAILRAQFPGLRADSVAWLGEGMDSVAFDVDGAWVFRFPKRQDVEQQLLLEFEVLPTVAAASPVPVPDYRFIGQPSDLFPRAFGGYARLPGVPGNVVTVDAEGYRQLALQVGGFLSALHAFPLRLLPGRLPVQPIADVLRELGDAAIGELGSLDRVIPGGTPRRWRTWFEQIPAAESPPAANVLVHGDLAAEHILLDPAERTVTGVIDWSEIALSGAALDLAALYHWGGDELADAALNHYEQPVTTAMLQQARYIAACRAVLDVAFGLETGRAEYITGALRLLHDAKLPTGGRS